MADTIAAVELELEEGPTGQVCEKCGRKMVIKWGRRGKFLSCSGFPECKNAKSIGSGVKFPQEGCGGELVQRKSKRGFFYGCSNYPKCDFATWQRPGTEKPKKDAETPDTPKEQ